MQYNYFINYSTLRQMKINGQTAKSRQTAVAIFAFAE